MSYRYREPIITAWSTPGAAFLIAVLPTTPYAEMIGAYMLSAIGFIVLGASGYFERVVKMIPPGIAAGLLAGIPNDLKLSLRDAAKALEDGLEAHANALMATKTVTEGLVRSIAAEIASSRSAPAAYGRSGTVNPNARREASGLAVDAKA